MAFLEVFRSRRMAVLFLLGFASGTPLYLTGQLFTAWLTQEGVSIDQIAAFAIVGSAYTFKFCWAPLLDRYSLPFLGRRRGWTLVCQIGLMISIVAMGLTDPPTQPLQLGILAAALAIFSASQDVVLDAYSVDLLRPEERAAGSAIYVIGYRVAMMLTGVIALFLADYVPWSVIYCVIGASMMIGVVATLVAEEPAAPAQRTTLVQTLYLPFVELFRRYGLRTSIGILVFVAIFKFGDHFQNTLLFPFFIRGLHFSLTDIALIYKIVAFVAIFTGGLVSGSLVARFGLGRMLVVFGLLDGATSLTYSLAAMAGHDYVVFTTAVFIHNMTAAMGTAAFVAFMMSVCNKRVSATQMALLTSLSSLGQRIFGVFAGDVVNAFDGSGFDRLVAQHATIEELVRRGTESAAANLRWDELPVLLGNGYRDWLSWLTNPAGDGIVTYQNWPWFFASTAMMAIPGILLAGVIARAVKQREAGPTIPEAKTV